VRKVRETDREVLIAVDSTSELTMDLITSVIVPGKATRFEWPRQELNAPILMDLSNRFFVQIGMEALQLNFDPALARLQVRTFDDQTTKRIVAKSYESGYADVWKGQIPDPILERFRVAIDGLATSKSTRIIEVDGKVAGLVIVGNFETYRGDKQDHIAWVWIDSTIPRETRRAVGATLLKATAQIAPGKVLAGLYIRNMKSYRFLRNAGFESICVTLLEP